MTANPDGETHGVIVHVPVKLMSKPGTYRFVLHFYDDYADSYKNHQVKAALEVNAPARRIIVCIDPGHGGDDPGAVGPTGLKEKEVNLKIALKVAERLRNRANKKISYIVRLTRKSDISLKLQERINIAEIGRPVRRPNDPKEGADMWVSETADIFVSIHNNAFPSPGPLGSEVRYSTIPKRDRKGNKRSDKPLAQFLYNRLHKVNPGNRIDGCKEDSELYVLKYTMMPAALCECEFISSPEGEKKLKDESFLEEIAEAIYLGINDYVYAYNP